jgi:hypothetical protein
MQIEEFISCLKLSWIGFNSIGHLSLLVPKDQHASQNSPPYRGFCSSPSCTGYFHLHLNSNVVVIVKNVNEALLSLSNALEEVESLQLRAQREAKKQRAVRLFAIRLFLF